MQLSVSSGVFSERRVHVRSYIGFQKNLLGATVHPVQAYPSVTSEDVLMDLVASYVRVRAASQQICEPLEIEDYGVQSMPEASPPKWHLAHTTWFFEHFVLQPLVPDYQRFHPHYGFLFNSYYQGAGPQLERSERGRLSRPTVQEINEYRAHVDEQLQRLLGCRSDAELTRLVWLGLHHEQQHQELLLADIKHAFATNPLQPIYRHRAATRRAPTLEPLRFQGRAGGEHEIGAEDAELSRDDEKPRHRVILAPFAIADRLVTNAEYAEFIRDGGYRRAELWLADGWETVSRERWSRPLYWSRSLDAEFTLAGLVPLDRTAPVVHVSYYEADAFARWIGARLPTEAEWETVGRGLPIQGNLLEGGELHPLPAAGVPSQSPRQFFGDVWEWTASPYVGYPGYRPTPEVLAEYNGKFMCNRWVLRGGSCATPATHIRATYRNFLYPQARWQFSGVRLARTI